MLARNKLIWDDEFFTLYLSKTASWSVLWSALSTGADQHPPSFYYLTHLILNLAGTTHLTLRLTALFGFGLSCLCLYEIARELMGPRWGIPAMLLPLTTPALYYATEARGYGLELGFVTFSLLMWILATEGRRKSLDSFQRLQPVFGLATFVTLLRRAFSFFLWRGRTRQNDEAPIPIDIPVCGALLASLIPILSFLAPLIMKARNLSQSHFWAATQPGDQCCHGTPICAGTYAPRSARCICIGFSY